MEIDSRTRTKVLKVIKKYIKFLFVSIAFFTILFGGIWIYQQMNDSYDREKLLYSYLSFLKLSVLFGVVFIAIAKK